MADDTLNPMTPSGDYSAMKPYWDMVGAILGGVECLRQASRSKSVLIPGPAQAVGELNELQRGAVYQRWNESPYLPRFPNESQQDYDARRAHAPLTNIAAEISDNLSAKPFAKPCELDEAEPDELKKLSNNIDGQGHNLHTFARDVFKAGLDYGIDWILVDHTKVPPGATQKIEQDMGARPYWVRIPASRMIAAYSAFVNGEEAICHARIYEPVTRIAGYGEIRVDRIREFNRVPKYNAMGELSGFEDATWLLLEKVTTEKDGKTETAWIEKGAGFITIGIIPLVPFVPVGRVDGSWKVKPAFHDISYMQIEEFQQESGLKYVREMNGFSMLALLGVTQQTNAGGEVVVPVGPKGVIILPPGPDGAQPDAKYIGPSGDQGAFLTTCLEKLQAEMRNLGRQPMASANLTVVTTANVSMKASSAVQAWALLLKDALEQAWIITCMWMKRDLEPVVNVHTDFAVDLEAGSELDALNKAYTAKVISAMLYFAELKRRNVLSDDADYEDDQEQKAKEQEGEQLQPEKMIDPITGQPLVVTPAHGIPNPPPPPKPPVIN